MDDDDDDDDDGGVAYKKYKIEKFEGHFVAIL